MVVTDTATADELDSKIASIKTEVDRVIGNAVATLRGEIAGAVTTLRDEIANTERRLDAKIEALTAVVREALAKLDG